MKHVMPVSWSLYVNSRIPRWAWHWMTVSIVFSVGVSVVP